MSVAAPSLRRELVVKYSDTSRLCSRTSNPLSKKQRGNRVIQLKMRCVHRLFRLQGSYKAPDQSLSNASGLGNSRSSPLARTWIPAKSNYFPFEASLYAVQLNFHAMVTDPK